MSIEKLSEDFTATVPATNTGFFGEVKVEAPALFKRNDFYWAVCLLLVFFDFYMFL